MASDIKNEDERDQNNHQGPSFQFTESEIKEFADQQSRLDKIDWKSLAENRVSGLNISPSKILLTALALLAVSGAVVSNVLHYKRNRKF